MPENNDLQFFVDGSIPECNCEECLAVRSRAEYLDQGWSGVSSDGRPWMNCSGTECYGCNPTYSCDNSPDWPDDDSYEEDHEEPESPDDEAGLEVEAFSVDDPSPALIRPTINSSLFLPVLPNRPIRLMSFEQEVGSGASTVANDFYKSKYSPYQEILGYGSSYDVARTHRSENTFAHVEYDSSCGGEIIYSKIDLSNDNLAHRFESAISDVRTLIRNGSVRLDMHCGFHIHVGLGFDEPRGISAYSMSAVENLYHAHNFLEDFLYRIGASKWSSHRTEVNETNYSQQTPKGYKGKVSIGNVIRRDRYALNLSNYLGARGDCSCGAFQFAAWEECTCRLDKPTVEFRWPNATANPRKIHAFSSLLQGLVARCAIAEPGEFANLPDQGFQGIRNKEYPEYESVIERINWIGANIPQTREERASLAYCISDHFGPEVYTEEYENHIRGLPYEKNELVAIR